MWVRIGALGFGGPAGQIALIHREVVAERRWIDEPSFTSVIALTSLLPGPEAHQTATYVGWLRGGLRSALVASLLFVAPGAVIIGLLAGVYVGFGEVSPVAGFFTGLQASAVALLILALVTMARRTLTSTSARILASMTFLVTTATVVPYPAIAVIVAALGWWLGGRAGAGPAAPSTSGPPRPRLPRWRRAPGDWSVGVGPVGVGPVGVGPVGVGLVGLGLLGAVLAGTCAIILLARPPIDGLTATLTVSAVTFGGAYAILDFATSQLVEVQGLLTADDMAAGLGLAESTPGPLILVLEFASFIALAREAPLYGLPWWAAGSIGAVLAVAILFLSSTGIVLACAPFADALRSSARAAAALRAVAASVVGVLASLGLVLAVNVCFTVTRRWELGPLQVTTPDPSSLDVLAVGLILLATAGLASRRLPHWQLVLICGGLGALLSGA